MAERHLLLLQQAACFAAAWLLGGYCAVCGSLLC
jgi:hypothetical protein